MIRTIVIALLLASCGSSATESASSSTTASEHQGRGSPDSTNAPTSAASPEDPDGDRLVSSVDLCPTDAEDFDGYQDVDGCPDLDNDGDSVMDADDQCPNEPESPNGFEDFDGCPDGAPAPGVTS